MSEPIECLLREILLARPLAECVDKHGQTGVARRTGLTQGGVRKLLQSDRVIRLLELPDGRYRRIDIQVREPA